MARDTSGISDPGNFGPILPLIISAVILAAMFCLLFYEMGVEQGRIDIASGRVTATLETKPDGTTRWVFEEADDGL